MRFIDPLSGVPAHERTNLLPLYTKLFYERTREGFWEDLTVEVGRKEYLQIIYETHLYRGVAASGGALVWCPWPTDPDQDLPVQVEIRLAGGRVVFREQREPLPKEAPKAVSDLPLDHAALSRKGTA